LAKNRSDRNRVKIGTEASASKLAIPAPLDKNEKNKYVVLLYVGLVVMILTVYLQVGNHQFLNFDDDVYVTNNPHVASGITGNNIIWAFTSVTASNWHPVTWISHMADVELFGMNPRGHHLTNVVIHLVSSILLLHLLFRSTGSLWESSLVAFLFALHPLHVESVAWIAERKDVLSAFFGFLTLIFYSEYVLKLKPGLYLFSLLFFVLGLMAKPMLVTLPMVMLLLDIWPLNRYRREGQEHDPSSIRGRIIAFIKEKIPFIVCSLLSAIVTIHAQNKGMAIRNFDEMPIGLRIENVFTAYVKYIGKTLWPHDLAILYPFPLTIPLWQVISSSLVLLLLTAAAIRAARKYPYLAVGWFWFLVTLFPVIGLIQVGSQSMADRYSYIPVIGLFIMAAWGVSDLTKGLRRRKVILSIIAGTVISASAVATWIQIGFWRDNISLYQHNLQVTSGSAIVHNNLGIAYVRKGDVDTAIEEFKQALWTSPNYADAHDNLGNALAGKGATNAAIQEFQEALRINPQHLNAHYNLGIVALAGTGDPDTAIREFHKVLQLNPNHVDAHNNLGVALFNKGDLDGAIKEFQEALRLSPDYANAHDNLEHALAQKNRKEVTK
jgi:protein O-mannosyl-transferase